MILLIGYVDILQKLYEEKRKLRENMVFSPFSVGALRIGKVRVSTSYFNIIYHPQNINTPKRTERVMYNLRWLWNVEEKLLTLFHIRSFFCKLSKFQINSTKGNSSENLTNGLSLSTQRKGKIYTIKNKSVLLNFMKISWIAWSHSNSW